MIGGGEQQSRIAAGQPPGQALPALRGLISQAKPTTTQVLSGNGGCLPAVAIAQAYRVVLTRHASLSCEWREINVKALHQNP